MSKSISQKYFTFVESCHAWFKWWVFYLLHENRRNYIPREERTRPVSILANGPSLKNFDKSVAERSDCCTVNFAPLSDLFFQVMPKYHVMIDDSFFLKENLVLKDKLNAVSWQMTIFVPFRCWKQALSLYGDNTNISFIPVHSTGISDSFSFKKTAWRLFRKGKAMPVPQNVLVCAIFCMINSGYRHIDLYGADHNWIYQMVVDENNRLMLKYEHFYDQKPVTELTPFLLGDGTPSTLSQELRFQAKAFAAYEMLQEYALAEGVEIRNCTKGSLIDAFPR